MGAIDNEVRRMYRLDQPWVRSISPRTTHEGGALEKRKIAYIRPVPARALALFLNGATSPI